MCSLKWFKTTLITLVVVLLLLLVVVVVLTKIHPFKTAKQR